MITKNSRSLFTVIGVIVIAVFSICLGACEKSSHESENFSKADLHDTFSGYISEDEEELSFFCEDFDNNGTLEAFGTTARFNECLDEDFSVYPASIYFINDKGGIQEILLNGEEGWETFMEEKGRLIKNENEKFFVWEEEAANGSSLSHIFGVKNGEHYQPNISGTIGRFGVDEGRYVASTVIYYDPDHPDDTDLYWRRNLVQYFNYDKATNDFKETEREVTDGY